MPTCLKSVFLVVVLVAVGAACGSSSHASGPASTATSTSTTAGSEATPTITISKELRFSSVPVHAGATVTVRNDSAAEHTVSADTAAGAFDITSEPGKTMTFTAPSKPGAYRYHCNIHTFMHGTLEVI